ncbi:uncharacterized protein LOC144109529 [Amblyomma americanum]
MADTQSTRKNEEIGVGALLLIWLGGFALGCLIGTSGVAIYAHFSPSDVNVKPPGDEKAQAAVCYAPGCVATTELLQDNINPLVAPCHNFQEYVCGRHEGPERSLLRSELNDAEMRMAYSVLALNQSVLGARRKAADLLRTCEDQGLLKRNAATNRALLRNFMDHLTLSLRPAAYQTAVLTADRHLTLHVELAFTYALSGLFTVRPSTPHTIRVAADLPFMQETNRHLHSPDYFHALVVAYTGHEDLNLTTEGLNLYIDVTLAVAAVTRRQNLSPFTVVKVRDVALHGVSADAFANAIEESTPYARSADVELDAVVPEVVKSVWQKWSVVDRYLWTSWHVLAQCALHTSWYVASKVDDRVRTLACFRRVSAVLGPPLAAVHLFAEAGVQELVGGMVRNLSHCLTKNASQWVRKFEAKPVVGLAPSMNTESALDSYYESIPVGDRRSFLSDWQRVAAVRSRRIAPQELHVDAFQEDVSVYPDGSVVVPALLLKSRLVAVDGPHSVYYGGLGHTVARSMAQRFMRPDAPDVLPCAADKEVSKAPDFRENLLAYWCVRSVFASVTRGRTEERLPMMGVLDPPPKLLLTMGCLKASPWAPARPDCTKKFMFLVTTTSAARSVVIY